jgi:endogenous inhibitor of DNA gyrase (YacG/DUF329 family)
MLPSGQRPRRRLSGGILAHASAPTKCSLETDRMVRMDTAPRCVLCRRRPQSERWRPFCSERCRNEDLARWAEGRYRVPGDPVPTAESVSDSEDDDE